MGWGPMSSSFATEFDIVKREALLGMIKSLKKYYDSLFRGFAVCDLKSGNVKSHTCLLS
jgi:hypothetical protein